jgi:hypothetical protein
MKRRLFSPPEQFSLSPLLALLPVLGKVDKLEGLTASLFARYEKVMALRKSVAEAGDTDNRRRLDAEANMLSEVLAWLEIRPEPEG